MNYKIEKLKKCYKYRDLESAIFLSQDLAEHDSEFNLLTGILLYENEEYSRSIFYLKDIQTTTSLFYLALNYKKVKKYSEAIVCLNLISDNQSLEDCASNEFIKEFILSQGETEFIDSLLGELYTLKGRSKTGCERYRKVLFKNPLLKAVFGLFDERIQISPINDFLGDPIMELYQNLSKVNPQGEQSLRSPKSLAEAITIYPEIDFYIARVPGTGSYFFSKFASAHCKFGEIQLGAEIFELLRDRDFFHVQDLDVYSTTLWKLKNENMLGLLAKDLISFLPSSHITWSVIGNYYSFKGMTKESTTCFMKSLTIRENPLAYSLLGFEYNTRSQYLEAQGYFKSSMAMLENNDKAQFGLGITLNETFKKQAAEQCFKHALALNPSCMNMKAYLVRFYVRHKEYSKAVEKVKEFLSIDSNDFNEIASAILRRFGSFTEMEELILCELSEIMLRLKYRDLARSIIDCVMCRTNSYYSKKSLIENETT